jgi:glyoxylase I family protein
MKFSFDHAGLSVADLDASARFYCDVFGFAPEFAFELTPHPVRGQMLVHPSGCRLELFEHAHSRPGIQDASPIDALATRGYGHFGLTATDLDEAFEAAVAAGAQPVKAPGPSPEPGVQFAFLADPDGNLVELIGRTASE